MVDSNAEPSKIEPTRFDSQTQIYQGDDETVEGIFFFLSNPKSLDQQASIKTDAGQQVQKMCQCNANNRIKRRTFLSWNGPSIFFHPSSQLCHLVCKNRRLINAADLHSLSSRFALARFSRRTGAGGQNNPLNAPNIPHDAACCVWPSLVWCNRTFVWAPWTSAGMSLQPPAGSALSSCPGRWREREREAVIR